MILPLPQMLLLPLLMSLPLVWPSGNAIRAAEDRPFNLRCEFRHDPLGVNQRQPMLTWNLPCTSQFPLCAGYRVLVASSPQVLDNHKGDLWDTGRINCTDDVSTTYCGTPLKSGTRYYWKVMVWNQSGVQSQWSDTAEWEMGLLESPDWVGTWISDGKRLPKSDADFYKDDPAPYFRGTFVVHKPIKSARLYISGLGINEPYLNGTRIGNHNLDPAWTTYAKRTLYSTYDVTDLIRPGSNCLGVMLGNGWFNVLPLRMWGQLNLRDFMQSERPRFIAQLNIEHTDGSIASFCSGNHWKTTPGPVLRNSIYLGEQYDARKEFDNWSYPEFDDSVWTSARQVDAPKSVLKSQTQPPVVQTAEFKPVSIKEVRPGTFIFDFGTNMAGKVRLQVTGNAGEQVKLRFGELLYPDGSLNVMTTVCGQIKQSGMGGEGAPALAEQSDTYILRGDPKGESYEPRFTYHAFRYVEMTGYPGTPGKNSLTAIRCNSAVESAGSFTCSNELLNRIQEMCLATFPSNLMGIQTDCPGRERFPYGDDIACTCEAHLYNYDMATFYAKTVRDFADAARPNGALTLLAPWTGHASGGFDPGGGAFADKDRNGENAGTGPLSGVLAHSLLLWKSYQIYGNQNLVEEQYEVARRSLDFITQQTPDHIVHVGLGDWCAIKPTDTSVLDTALYYQHACLVSQLASIVGQADDAQKYQLLADSIRTAFINAFVKLGPEKSPFNTQAAWACGIFHGLIPPHEVSHVLDLLVDDVEQHHLTTGIFGTKYLLNSLTRCGRPDVAFRIVNRTEYPGWGYMLQSGATTLWEDWQFSDNTYSHNHSMFGTVSAWFFQALGGIGIASDAIGCNKIILHPHVVHNLDWVRCSYRSVRGEIVSNWAVDGNRLTWQVTIPPTTSAEVQLPDGFGRNTEIRDLLRNQRSINSDIQQEKTSFTLVPGKYEIVAQRR